MKTVTSYEAKTHLAQLLDDVAKGETITITRRGTAVAVLSPVAKGRQEALAAVADWREFRKGIRLDGLSIRDMIEEGRM